MVRGMANIDILRCIFLTNEFKLPILFDSTAVGINAWLTAFPIAEIGAFKTLFARAYKPAAAGLKNDVNTIMGSSKPDTLIKPAGVENKGNLL